MVFYSGNQVTYSDLTVNIVMLLLLYVAGAEHRDEGHEGAAERLPPTGEMVIPDAAPSLRLDGDAEPGAALRDARVKHVEWYRLIQPLDYYDYHLLVEYFSLGSSTSNIKFGLKQQHKSLFEQEDVSSNGKRTNISI